MPGTRNQHRDLRRVRAPKGPVLETLEPRMLLSASLPDGFAPPADVYPRGESGAVEQAALFGLEDPLALRVYMPEGYSGALDNSDRIAVSNPGGAPLTYRIVLRFERGERDLILVAETTLAPFETAYHDAAAGAAMAGREEEPFAIEVHSSAPVAAVLRHEDIRGVIGESFFDPAPYSEPDLMSWLLPGRPQRELGDDFRSTAQFDYLLWQNISVEAATLEITFLFAQADPVMFTVQTEALRRAGLELFAIAAIVDAGEPAAVRIVSTQPIVAFMSTHTVTYPTELEGEPVDGSHLRELQGGPAAALLTAVAAGSHGTPGDGVTAGYLAAEARFASTPDALTTLSIVNPGAEVAVVTLTFTPRLAAPVVTTVNVEPGHRTTLRIDPAALGLAATDRDPVIAPYALTFTSTRPVGVEYGDARSATTPATLASPMAHVGDVEFNRQFPVFSVRDRNFVTVFNPAELPVTARVIMRDFLGEVVFTQDLGIGPGRIASAEPLSSPSFTPLLELFAARSATDPIWNQPRLSISVEGLDGAPLIVQFLRTVDTGTLFASGAYLMGPATPLGITPE